MTDAPLAKAVDEPGERAGAVGVAKANPRDALQQHTVAVVESGRVAHKNATRLVNAVGAEPRTDPLPDLLEQAGFSVRRIGSDSVLDRK